jgi:D-sedoheptulose 7-phosphate isomerase
MMVKAYFDKINQTLNALNLEEVEAGIELILSKWKEGKQIITLGNGGSAMTALHFITDWNKMIYLKTGIPFRGRTLVDNMGIITAYSNDLSYEDVFAEQLKNIMNPGDLVIAISGSGNSPNVLKAVEYANQNKGVTLGLTGFSGGKLKNMVNQSIWVDIHDMQITEDVHAMFGHIVMQRVCNA